MALADARLLLEQAGLEQRLADLVGERAVVAGEPAREVAELRVVAAPLAHPVEALEDPARDPARGLGVVVRAGAPPSAAARRTGRRSPGSMTPAGTTTARARSRSTLATTSSSAGPQLGVLTGEVQDPVAGQQLSFAGLERAASSAASATTRPSGTAAYSPGPKATVTGSS